MSLRNVFRKLSLACSLHLGRKSVIDRKPTMSNSLQMLLDSGVEVGVVLDVGIYTGTEPLMEVFSKIKHHLFEPVDTHFNVISDNYKKIPHELHHVALSDKDGSVSLVCSSINNDGKITHSKIVSGKVSREEVPNLVSCVEVNRARLDSIVNETTLKAPYLLKIDVDGHEMSVLRGAVQTLKSTSIVVIEAPLSKGFPSQFFERANFLMENDFCLVDMVDFAYYDGVLWQVDLVFVRKDIVDNIDRLRPFERDGFVFEGKKWSLMNDRL